MDPFEKELETGHAVVLPTETVYGLFAKALDEAAVDQVYALMFPVKKTFDFIRKINHLIYQN